MEIKQWFDQKYADSGFSYLRPLSAYSIFRTLLDAPRGGIHLDVACGPGLMLKTMEQSDMKLFGIDLSSEAINQCKKYCPNAIVQEGNAEALPYEGEKFDTVSCLGSLERMLDREQALSEISRVSKSSATICVMVRNSENFTWKYVNKPLRLYNKAGHQDAMNFDAWRQLFEECGFVIKSVYPDHWPFYRIIKSLTPVGSVDTSKVRKFPFSIKLAYEFIFVLKKQ